jgi:hypothetical protein
VKRVFPALRQRLEPHRINLVDIDLRWGITREQADNDQVLGLCLQQIDECRPFFVGLLGGRYGWVPSKFPVEVGKRYGWTQHHTGKSVTELEILHGVLNDPSMHGRALFCFRSGDFLSDIKDAEKRRVYVEGPTDEELREFGPEEAEHRAAVRRRQLADLKNQIRALSPPMPLFDGYPCTWEEAGSSRREGVLPNWVAQTSKSAVSQVSKPAPCEYREIPRVADRDVGDTAGLETCATVGQHAREEALTVRGFSKDLSLLTGVLPKWPFS